MSNRRRKPRASVVALTDAMVSKQGVDIGTWSKPVNIGRGCTARLRFDYEEGMSLADSGDLYGKVYHSDRHTRQRPAECNGAARKIQTRSDCLWWQPPEDVLADPKGLESVYSRVRDYYLEYWCFVRCAVEVTGPPCGCCGARSTSHDTLGGIESDAGEYWTEVVGDVLAVAQAEVLKRGKAA